MELTEQQSQALDLIYEKDIVLCGDAGSGKSIAALAYLVNNPGRNVIVCPKIFTYEAKRRLDLLGMTNSIIVNDFNEVSGEEILIVSENFSNLDKIVELGTLDNVFIWDPQIDNKNQTYSKLKNICQQSRRVIIQARPTGNSINNSLDLINETGGGGDLEIFKIERSRVV